MNTLWSAPERQYNNFSADYSADISAIASRPPRLLLSIVSADPGSFIDVSLELSRAGAPVCSAAYRMDTVGKYQLGLGYETMEGVSGRLVASLTGRMRMSASVVTFDPGEDVPEGV